MDFNEYQSTLEQLNLDNQPQEIKEQFLDFLYNVPYIRKLVSPDRKRAKDLPRDSEGKIIIDITEPHIIEDTDYFRPAAIEFQKSGKYTNLRPNSNPNSDYGKWIREEVRRCFDGYIRPSDGEWITGDMYFFLNYCPIQLIKKDDKGKSIRTVDFPQFWEGHYYRFHYLNQCRNEGKHAVELASRFKGKAHPYSQIVYTPKGRKLWKDVHIGDILFGDNGNITKVVDIPFDEETDIYNVQLLDGRIIQCSLEHLFRVKDCRKGNHTTVKSLKDILRSGYCNDRKNGKQDFFISIPRSKGIEFKERDVLIDPYTLGVLLGGNCSYTNSLNSVVIDCSEEGLEVYKQYIPYSMYKAEEADSSYKIYIENIKQCLDYYGLINEDKLYKFIPDDYLCNTKEVRISLLKGLLDIKGQVNSSGRPIVKTFSERFSQNIASLCRSLGYNTYIFKQQGRYKNKNQRVLYTITILTDVPLFNIQSKLSLIKPFDTAFSKERRDWIPITNIKYSHREKAKCVTVDNDSHCYLIGEFVVTHNSYCGAALLAKRFVLGESKQVKNKVQCMVTASEKKFLTGGNQILDMFQSYIDFTANNTQFPYRRLVSSLQNMQWVMGYVDVNTNTRRGTGNSVMGITSKDDESKLRGSRGVLYLIEEAGTFSRLKSLYQVLLPSVQDGSAVYGLIYAYGCVCKDTIVVRPNGEPALIQDVKKEDELLGYDGTTATTERISWLQPKGYKECVRIYTEKSNYIDCSIDHPILAVNMEQQPLPIKTCSFYLAEELKVGDVLLMPKKIGTFGNINEPHAFLLGTLMEKSYYSENEILSLENMQIYFKSLFPLLKKYNIDEKSFEGGLLPKSIFDWNKESVCAFLGGYFSAKGNIQGIKQKYRNITVPCKNKKVLQQIKYLLHKLGISSHICEESRVARVKHSNVKQRDCSVQKECRYVLQISNNEDIQLFKENIKLLVNQKQEKLDSFNYKSRRKATDTFKFQVRKNRKGELLEGKHFDNLETATVKSIEPLGVQEIYNMTADTTHTYISNGFISSNTAGDSKSDFSAMQEFMYNPTGYFIKPLENIYDKEGQGRLHFSYFFPGYVNRANCYNKDGISDVTKALLEILQERYVVRHNSTDITAITKKVAEVPITPQEAIIKSQGNIFPSIQLNERLNEIDNNPNFYDDTYVGYLKMDKSGKVSFTPTNDVPIREFPLKDNKSKGAVEIFQMPEKDQSGKVYANRYYAGNDPVDQDTADTKSLFSVFILDLFTDKIVAEYTGRQLFADDNYEIVRLLCMFYNAKCMYENNKRGMYAYFSKMGCTHLLCDTPQYLKDKQIIKITGYGNSSKGVTATQAVNNYALELLRDWLLLPVPTIITKGNEEKEITVPNLYFIKNRALLQELIKFNPYINVDRIHALGMAMLYRQEKMILYRGDIKNQITHKKEDFAENDSFFTENYDRRFGVE